jgi:hypothetical protein
MLGCHPVPNLASIAADSVFVMGARDPFILERRSAALVKAIQRFAPRARIFSLDAGHVKNHGVDCAPSSQSLGDMVSVHACIPRLHAQWQVR